MEKKNEMYIKTKRTWRRYYIYNKYVSISISIIILTSVCLTWAGVQLLSNQWLSHLLSGHGENSRGKGGCEFISCHAAFAFVSCLYFSNYNSLFSDNLAPGSLSSSVSPSQLFLRRAQSCSTRTTSSPWTPRRSSSFLPSSLWVFSLSPPWNGLIWNSGS